jgi:hypothetical protein
VGLDALLHPSVPGRPRGGRPMIPASVLPPMRDWLMRRRLSPAFYARVAALQNPLKIEV